MTMTMTALWPAGVHAADDVHGSAHLTYRLTQTESAEGETSTASFDQIYQLGVRKELTPKMTFLGDLDVTLSETDGEKSTCLAPDLRLDVANEYFDAMAGYRVTEKNANLLAATADGVRETSRTWNLDLVTKLRRYPVLRLRYNEDRDYDHLDERESDSQSTAFAGSLDYGWRWMTFSGTLRRTTDEDYVNDLSQETLTREGRASFNRSFLENALHASGSYSLVQTTSAAVTGAEDVTVYEQLLAVQGLYAQEKPDPGRALEPMASLVDGDRENSTGIDVAGPGSQGRHLGLDLDYAREADQLRLYVQDEDFDARAFVWEVWSSDDGVDWERVTAAAEFAYDDEERRFEIDFQRTEARYFKVVNAETDLTVSGLEAAELEAWASRTYEASTTTESERLTENGQLTLGYSPWQWLTLGYDASRYRQESDDGAGAGTRTSHAFSARAERDLHRLLRTVAQLQRRMEMDSAGADTATDSASVHLLSSPLETLDTDLSLSHSQSTQDGVLQSRSDAALLQVSAALRRGADMEVDLSASRYENVAGGSATDSRGVETALQLDLTRTVTAELEQSMTWSKTTGSPEDLTSIYKATAYWRPSRDIYYRGTWRLERDEKSGQEELLQQYAVNWLPTRKVQVALHYSREDNGGSLDTLALDLSWNISRVFSLVFGYDFSRQQDDSVTTTQTFTTDLTARF